MSRPGVVEEIRVGSARFARGGPMAGGGRSAAAKVTANGTAGLAEQSDTSAHWSQSDAVAIGHSPRVVVPGAGPIDRRWDADPTSQDRSHVKASAERLRAMLAATRIEPAEAAKLVAQYVAAAANQRREPVRPVPELAIPSLAHLRGVFNEMTREGLLRPGALDLGMSFAEALLVPAART